MGYVDVLGNGILKIICQTVQSIRPRSAGKYSKCLNQIMDKNLILNVLCLGQLNRSGD